VLRREPSVPFGPGGEGADHLRRWCTHASEGTSASCSACTLVKVDRC
jgi:hypothetical protein